MRIVMLLHKSVEFDSRVRREAAALAQAGHEVTVLELAPVPRDAALLEGFHRRSVMPSSWLRRWLPFQLYRVAFLGSFIQEILRLHPDVVHAHDAAMLVPGQSGRGSSGPGSSTTLTSWRRAFRTGGDYGRGSWKGSSGSLCHVARR